MTPLLKPLSDALAQANATIASLRKRIDKKDNAIANLEQQVRDLDIRVDDLEQQGRRGSMRVFGIPEDTPGSVDLKILTLCNKQMKVSPPLTLEDLEVVHRLGKPLPGRAGSSDVPDDVTPVPTPGSTPTDADLQSGVPVSGDAVQTAPSDQVYPSPTTSRPVLVKFARPLCGDPTGQVGSLHRDQQCASLGVSLNKFYNVMEVISVLLAPCAGNPQTSGFPSQMVGSGDFLLMYKLLNKQLKCHRSQNFLFSIFTLMWRHCNVDPNISQVSKYRPVNDLYSKCFRNILKVQNWKRIIVCKPVHTLTGDPCATLSRPRCTQRYLIDIEQK